MAFGPGKYDEFCTILRQATKAKGAIIIIVEGFDGSGISSQLPALETAMMPDVLRNLADDIEREMKKVEKHDRN